MAKSSLDSPTFTDPALALTLRREGREAEPGEGMRGPALATSALFPELTTSAEHLST